MNHAKRIVVIQKSSTNRLNDDVVSRQLNEMARGAIGKSLGNRGWTARRPRVEHIELPDGWVCRALLSFHRDCRRSFTQESLEAGWADITRKLLSRGKANRWGPETAVVGGKDGGFGVAERLSFPEPSAESKAAVPEFAGAAAITIPEDWQTHFAHIYDRDDQIAEIMASIRTAKDTNMEVRNHPMLYGPPGCGKTEIGLVLERMLGTDAVLKLDATNTTKAGAENLILEREPIPPILILEELEKCNEANVPWLLGIMDDRGEIIKTNARVGSVRRSAPMLVMCTVNDLAKFNEFQSGALVNRFNVPLYFPRPSRDLLRRILLREVSKIPGGRTEWVEPALDYAINFERTYQARRIKAIMSNARDGLLDGTFQAARERMSESQTADIDAGAF
jgi:MoxR-like ATPase